MSDWKSDRIGSALRGENPAVIRRLPAGFAVMGDIQFLPGYSLLLADDPSVTRLSDLSTRARRDYLSSMALLAEAVERACAEVYDGFRRVNIEILGNTDAFLHAHVFPRYDWESPDLVRKPVWLYPAVEWADPSAPLGPEHDPIRAAIFRHLETLLTSA